MYHLRNLTKPDTHPVFRFVPITDKPCWLHTSKIWSLPLRFIVPVFWKELNTCEWLEKKNIVRTSCYIILCFLFIFSWPSLTWMMIHFRTFHQYRVANQGLVGVESVFLRSHQNLHSFLNWIWFFSCSPVLFGPMLNCCLLTTCM